MILNNDYKKVPKMHMFARTREGVELFELDGHPKLKNNKKNINNKKNNKKKKNIELFDEDRLNKINNVNNNNNNNNEINTLIIPTSRSSESIPELLSSSNYDITNNINNESYHLFLPFIPSFSSQNMKLSLNGNYISLIDNEINHLLYIYNIIKLQKKKRDNNDNEIKEIDDDDNNNNNNNDNDCIIEINKPDTLFMEFSPNENYLLTWQRPTRRNIDDNTTIKTHESNCFLYKVDTGELLFSWYYKRIDKLIWPYIQFSSNDNYMIKYSTNQLRLYDCRIKDNIIQLDNNILLKNIKQFSISPGKLYNIAIFVKGKNNSPGKIYIYRIPEYINEPIIMKSIGVAEEVKFHWAHDGSSLLVQTHTEIDTTGNSYFGSSSLYLIKSDGTYDCNVIPSKPGPIHDAAWNPSHRIFIIIAGRMPSVATLYNEKAEPIFEFGQKAKNTISFSPHGRFVCIAGFGNLAGHMDFWDIRKKSHLGENTANCAVAYGWSPDSSYFMTATMAPRMNVDNGFDIYRYDGQGPILSKKFTWLYECQWRNASINIYPNRLPSPPPKRPIIYNNNINNNNNNNIKNNNNNDNVNNDNNNNNKKKKLLTGSSQPYRPPGASGRLAALLRNKKETRAETKIVKSDNNTRSKKYTPPNQRDSQNYIPGLTRKPKSKKKKQYNNNDNNGNNGNNNNKKNNGNNNNRNNRNNRNRNNRNGNNKNNRL